MDLALILSLALVLDAVFGEPDWLWSRLAHPAVLMGRVIGRADGRLNAGAHRKSKGLLFVTGLVVGAGVLGWGLSILGPLVEILVAAILLAQRSLVDHVRAVADGLRDSLPAGRAAVAMIVGRDTADLDDAGVTRAAIESAAENFSDGVVAPALWFLLGGLPGILIYKTVNTADSMIGYKTPRHAQFGWAAARLDDLLNWLPARLSVLFFGIAFRHRDLYRQAAEDAPKHRSPNAGWPEAAMAHVLNVALAGPRSYEGALRAFAFVHPAGRREIGAAEIDAACDALWRAWTVMLGLVVLLGALSLVI